MVLLAFGAAAGWRAGLLAPLLGLAGGIAGFGLALAAASALRPELAALDQPERALVTLLGLLALSLGGEALAAGLGASASRRLRETWLRSVDALGGALLGAAHVVLLVWLLGGLLLAGLSPTLGPALGPVARESRILGAVYGRLPPPTAVAGQLLALLRTTGLPALFAGLEPPPAPPLELPPDPEVRALAASGLAATARVVGTGCGSYQQVGSGFFVTPTHLVTNAHVVAGTDATTVTLGDVMFPATVVLFDPDADVAVLYAAEAAAPSLELSGALPERGAAAAVLGFPGGGPLTVSAAVVTAIHDVSGPDIYGEGQVPHSVVEVRADIRQGNSGGPLMIAPGVVGGVVFGESRTAQEVGYAISAPSVRDAIGPAAGATMGVDTGPCA